MSRILLLAISISFLFPSCAFRRISRHKDIVYQAAEQKIPPQELSVFAPRMHKRDSLREVLIFIHGGNWIHGKKELYNWFGSRWARKGVVTVIIDYPLSPVADYRTMAADAAKS
ncbi:MAG: alpha/beta hydrolase, partial [Chitinophagaceae bacterium]